MQNPQFGGSINLGSATINAANTAMDGSGTLGTNLFVFLTGAGKIADCSFDNSTEEVTVTSWSQISSTSIGIIKNGDIVTLVTTGGAPSGLAINTDYMIGNLRISSDTAVFKLYNPTTYALVAFTTNGTSPHTLRFPLGTRVDSIYFINSQTSPAASVANRGAVFMSNRNSSTFFPIAEVALPTLTRSASVVGQRQGIIQTGGIFLPEGARLAAAIGAYSTAADVYTVYANQAINF